MGVAVANASCADTAVGADAAGVDAAGAELLLDPRQPCKENRDNVASATNLKRMVRIVIALKIKYCQKPQPEKILTEIPTEARTETFGALPPTE
jgi:hypothetical protein